MVDKGEILKVVRNKGPVIPSMIKKEIGSDTITIGALLSQLVGSEEIRISKTKIGGSPVYYMPEQRSKLQELRKYLNDKQQKAFDMLKDKKVLRDSELEPVIRVSLRDIKDFAKPFQASTNGETEIFWKWYMIRNDEAKQLIQEILDGTSPEPIKKKEKIPEKQEAGEEKKKTEEIPKKKDDDKEVKEKQIDVHDPLLEKAVTYFDSKGIEIKETEIIRKNTEIDLIVDVPSPIGDQEYFCKVRNKKKSTDADLSSAYVQGLVQRLPVLFLTTGDITNKAEERIKDEFKGMLVKKI